jgi:hypothetical protein
MAVGLGAAAALFLGLTLNLLPEEPFPVASAEDVDIISVEAADAGTLVIGEPPLKEPLVWASAGDVTLERVEPDWDGMVPEVRMPSEGPDPPMIVAPLEGGPAKIP